MGLLSMIRNKIDVTIARHLPAASCQVRKGPEFTASSLIDGPRSKGSWGHVYDLRRIVGEDSNKCIGQRKNSECEKI